MMEKYFGYAYDGPPFELFGTGHIIALGIIGSIIAFLVWGWHKPSEAGKRRGRYLVLGVFLVAELSWHAWNVAHGAWNILDLMGPWPWYLVSAQFVALFLFVLLYLPFAFADRRRRPEAVA